MNKKTFLLLSLLVILALVAILIFTQVKSPNNFSQTIPLLPTPTTTVSNIPVSFSASTAIPKQTNTTSAITQLDNTQTLAETNKLQDNLPIRINDFNTSVNIKTTIN